MAVHTPEKAGFVTSTDGVAIGYHQLGHGPGLVLLHGAMSSAANHMQLAEALASDFTVYVVDRRGRGLSGPYSKDYTIENAVDDLAAILNETGAHFVFGVSSGAIISLQAALTLPAIHKVAIYEPPLSLTRAAANAILSRFDREMAQGRVANALVVGMKGAQMGPPIFNLIPTPLLAFMVSKAMEQEGKQGTGDYVTMRALAPTLHYDFQLVAEMSEKIDSFRDIQVDVLLLGGSKSPAYLKAALDQLEQVLPHAQRIEFPGLGHEASWNTDKGGQPAPLAEALRQFFA